VQDALRHHRGVVHVVHQQRELVAAQARHAVAGAQAPLQAPRQRHQHLVGAHVPHAVVDHLEAVQVQEDHREAVAPGRRRA
jgi:hypothetical protein